MLNKEGILFTGVIVLFAILYVVQLMIIGYALTKKEERK